MPPLVKSQHVVRRRHDSTVCIPGMGITLKPMQQQYRRLLRIAPFDIMELHIVDMDKFILPKGGGAHSALLALAKGAG